MRKFSCLLFCILCLSAFAQKKQKPLPAPPDPFAGLDTAFARVLKDWLASGFAVAVVEKNKIVYEKGFGYRDFENKLPVTTNTLFAIGSCTKAFTCSLLGMLRQDGKVDFDKPVRNYLPSLKFYNDEMNNKITLRDMMCHRTGLPRHDLSWYYFQTSSRDSLVQRIQYMEPSASIRERWQYNNFMFLAQGVAIEKITNKSWEDNIREKIFGPLNMTHSVFSIEDMTKSGDAAFGYNLIKDALIKKTDYFHIDAMGPAGSINSCVNDMANWVMTWINGGRFYDKEVIPPAYLSEAISSQAIMGGALPDKEKKDIYFSNYGLGWMLSSYRGHYRVEHGGNIDGFSASTCFFPSDSVGIVVLVNQSNSTVPAVVRNLIADRMLGLKYFDWQTDLKNAADKAKAGAKDAQNAIVPDRKPNTKPSHDPGDYAGSFINKAYGVIDVAMRNDSLFANAGKHNWWLRHYHYDWFEPLEIDPLFGIDTSEKSQPLQFVDNREGNIELLEISLEPTLKPIVFTRIVKEKKLAVDSLQKFTGEYIITAITAKVYLKDDKLFLFVPGQPEYELVPTDTNKFNIKTLTGYSVQFNTDVNNKVTELLFIQPNGTFKATRKN